MDYSSEMGRKNPLRENFLRVVLSICTKGSGEVYIAAVEKCQTKKSKRLCNSCVKQTDRFAQGPISVKAATAQPLDRVITIEMTR